MTRDLEETLDELGPGYREVVARLTAPYRPRRHIPRAAYLVAASLVVLLGLATLFRFDSPRVERRSGVSDAKRIYTIAYAADETALRAIVASQRADGSWSNDFITRQNAAALRGAGDAASLVAYKRALRYLRSRGLEPLTDAELKARGARAARALSDVHPLA